MRFEVKPSSIMFVDEMIKMLASPVFLPKVGGPNPL